ncbi:hypothetical protein OGATHE_004364 [Ogataea polymorpha]|uniref:Uncharacterized protein n=1 Tax=Ogataea polymorpha TaxID=460523 RepID=A0A9P8NZJ0_9ASCO|nr:hypothetical protein OGATHE_004364 [Ogataea polymorpha]
MVVCSTTPLQLVALGHKRPQPEQNIGNGVDEDHLHLSHDLQLSYSKSFHCFFVQQLLDIQTHFVSRSVWVRRLWRLRRAIIRELGIVVAEIVHVFNVCVRVEVLPMQFGTYLHVWENKHQQQLADFVHDRVSQNFRDEPALLTADKIHFAAHGPILAHHVEIDRNIDCGDQDSNTVPDYPGQIPDRRKRLHVAPADLVYVTLVPCECE